jgi:TolB-like protein/DNA-binding winged helix-turn-helix (wHTH) protein/Flp pilus assembly protein TadD
MLKAYEVLVLLVQRHGHLVEKEEMLKQIWAEKFVEESNVAQNIHHLRKALDEGEQGLKFIETVPGRGYRFIASVREVRNEEYADWTTTEPSLIENLEPQQTNDDAGVAAVRSQLRPRHLVPIAVIVAAFALLIWIGVSSRNASKSQTSFRSFAVLPFKPLGNESSDELLGMGMADALITRLSNNPQFPVLPTSSVFKFTGREQDPLITGRELNVDAVLSGTVQRAGEKVRVTVQLIDVNERRTLWAETFDEQFTSIFKLQDTISNQIVTALALKLTGHAQEQMSKHHTENVEAYQAYLMGLYFWNKRSKENLAKSIDYCREAVARDPKYALAYALMADSYALMAFNGYGPLPRAEAFEKSQQAAQLALELDDTLAEAHLALAFVKSSYHHDAVGAEQSLTRAIALKPNYATAHHRYAWHLARKGQLAEAIEEMKRAQQLDPLSPTINAALASLFLSARNYDDAIRFSSRAVEIDPASYDGLLNMSEAFELKGMYQEALSALEKASVLDPKNSYTTAEFGRVYALSGRHGEAREVLQKLKQSTEENPPFYGIALIHLGLNERAEALTWLDKAITNNAVNSIQLRFDPKLDTLRPDPAFVELLRRHHLENLLS